jgi:hypothetical protein
MKFSEIGEYARLGLLVENPIELSRAKRTEGDLCARFRDGRRLQMHGGHSDIHTFRRVFLTDEYRLRRGPWDTVLDLGGNIGCVALRVARNARRVIVYEPTRSISPCSRTIWQVSTTSWSCPRRSPESGATASCTLREAAAGARARRCSTSPGGAPERGGHGGGGRRHDAGRALRRARDRALRPAEDRRGGRRVRDLRRREQGHVRADRADRGRISRRVPRGSAHADRGVLGLLEQLGFRVETKPSRKWENQGLFFAQRV